MAQKTLWKIGLLLKAARLLKNWYMYPTVYFGITKNPVVEFETKDGYKLKIRTASNSTDIHVFTEIWLENVYLQKVYLAVDSIVIDVGSHIGLFSLFVSKVCKNGLILSFEPNAGNYDILLQNISDNKIHNIKPNNMAVTSSKGTVKFYQSSKSLSAHSVYKKTESWTEVSSTSIEEIFNENKLEKCDLLKLDCEGAEYEILMSIPQNVLQKIHSIVVEYDVIENIQYTIEDVISRLKSNNFSVTNKKISPLQGFLYAYKSKLI